MKPLPTVIAAIAIIAVTLTAFPVPLKAAGAAPLLYNKGSLNGNICRSQGRSCHVPQPLNPAPSSQPVMMSQPPVTAAAPLVPAKNGLFSRIYSGFVSLF